MPIDVKTIAKARTSSLRDIKLETFCGTLKPIGAGEGENAFVLNIEPEVFVGWHKRSGSPPTTI